MTLDAVLHRCPKLSQVQPGIFRSTEGTIVSQRDFRAFAVMRDFREPLGREFEPLAGKAVGWSPYIVDRCYFLLDAPLPDTITTFYIFCWGQAIVQAPVHLHAMPREQSWLLARFEALERAIVGPVLTTKERLISAHYPFGQLMLPVLVEHAPHLALRINARDARDSTEFAGTVVLTGFYRNAVS